MQDENLIPHVEYASAIVQASLDGNYDLTATMNGLAIATAAMLVDTAIENASYKVDELALHVVVEQYIALLNKAVAFACAQLEAGSVAAC